MHTIAAPTSPITEAPALPCLPAEIVGSIISEVWNGPLSTADRITLMVSSLQVNRTWMTLFSYVSFRDVHVPCPSYARQYLRVIRQESPLYNACIPANAIGQTLTFHMEHIPALPDATLSETDHWQGIALYEVLHAITTRAYLPALRRVAIEYRNWSFNDLFDYRSLSAFPPQATHLALSYSFSAETPPFLVEALRREYTRQPRVPLQWGLPSVRRLCILGTGKDFALDVIALCPALQFVATDAFPPSNASGTSSGINRPVLCFDAPSVAPGRRTMSKAEWVALLSRGQFHSQLPRRGTISRGYI